MTALEHQTWLGYSPEVTYGTAIVPVTKFLEITAENLEGKNPTIRKPTLRGIDHKRRIAGTKGVSGSFKTPFHWNGMEMILKQALGAANTTGPVSTIYTHTFTLARALPVGMTLHVHRDALAVHATTLSAFQHSGCKITKLTLRQAVSEYLELEAEIMGRERVMADPIGSPTFVTWDPADFKDVTTQTINGVSVALESFELTIDNALGERHALGSLLTREPLRAGMRGIGGKCMFEFDDASLVQYNRYLAQNNSAFVIKWVSGSKELTVTLPATVATGKDPTPDSGKYKVEWSFDGDYNTADGDALSIVLANTTTAVA